MKELTKEFKNKLKTIGELEASKRRTTIFIDKHDPNIIYYPWKHLSKKCKLEFFKKYIKEHNIDFDILEINNYRLKNIVFEKNPGIIHSLELERK
jgi:hypothetical protein